MAAGAAASGAESVGVGIGEGEVVIADNLHPQRMGKNTASARSVMASDRTERFDFPSSGDQSEIG